MPILPQATNSIVDELKRRGFVSTSGEELPYFSLRENLYKQTGFEPILGEFKGTAQQNLKLLEYVTTKNITPQSLGQQSVSFGVSPTEIKPPTADLGTAPTIPQPSRTLTANELGIPKALTAQDVLSQIGTIPGTTAESVLATPRGSLEAQIAQRTGAEAIAAGEAGATAKAEQFGARGLYFSGARISAEGAVRATALAKKMGIDESLTKFIIQQQESGDKEIAQRVKDIVTDAVGKNKQARSEAITALRGLGYEVLPNGQIVLRPSEARAEAADIRAEEQAQFSRQIQTANYQLAQERLVLAKQKAQILGQFLTGQLADQTYDDFVIDARKEFNDPKNIGMDTKVSPYVFIKWRDLVKKSMPAKLDDFDKEFVPKLSKQEQDRLGVYVPSTKNTKVQMQAALEQLLSQPGILE